MASTSRRRFGVVEEPESNATASRPISIMGNSDHLSAQSIDIRTPGHDYIDKSTTRGTVTSRVSLAVNVILDGSGRESDAVSKEGSSIGTSGMRKAGDIDRTGPTYSTFALLWAVLKEYLPDIVRGSAAEGLQPPPPGEDMAKDQDMPMFLIRELKDGNEALPVCPQPTSGVTAPSEAYVRHLLKACRGLPCWNPRPRQPELLPLGIQPGDVGTYSTDAGFKKIFNLLEDEFVQGELEAMTASNIPSIPLAQGTTTYPQELRRGAVIAPGANCYSPPPNSFDQNHVVHEFRYPSTAGGILAVLSSADLVTTNDIDAMRTYIIQHAEALYRKCRPQLGENTCLYIITGSIKSDLWALAAYDKMEEGHAHDHIRLLQLSRTVAPTQDRPSWAYHWTQQPSATYPDHDDSGVEGLKNQSLFLHGFKLAFSDSFISRIEDTSMKPRMNHPGPTGGSSRGPDDGTTGSRGVGGSAQPPGGGPGEHKAGAAPGAVLDSLAQMNSTLSSDTVNCRGLGLEGHAVDFECSQFPPPRRHAHYHPCDTINELLLSSTGADIALSHDDDWRSLFRHLTQPRKQTEGLLESSRHDRYRLDVYGSRSITAEPVAPAAMEAAKNEAGRRTIVVRSGVACLETAPSGSQENDRSPRILDSTRSPDNGAKLLEVVEYFRTISPTEITLTPTGKSTMTANRVYHPFAGGGHADIYNARMMHTDGRERAVVVKIFRNAHLNTNNAEQRELYKSRLRREYGIWGLLNHCNILRLEGLAILDMLPSPGLVSEYKPHGDLARFMKSHHTFDRLHMGRGIVSGLEYLHRNNVVHGDLIPVNILVDQDSATGLFYGLITANGKSRILEKGGCTTSDDENLLLCSPPELLSYRKEDLAANKPILTPASDVYSISLIILQLITAKEPYSQEKIPLRIKAIEITSNERPLRPVPDLYPVLDLSFQFCWPLMQACWKTKQDERITSGDAHEWLRTRSPPTPLT